MINKRPEAKQEHPKRQLFCNLLRVAVAGAILFTFLNSAAAEGETASEEVRQQIAAAKMFEEAAFAELRRNPPESEEETKEALQKIAKVYEKLVARFPESAEARDAFAQCLWTVGEKSAAIDQWQEAERLGPENPAVLNSVGGAHLALGDTSKAAEYFKRATERAPGNALYHYNLANVYYVFRHDHVGVLGEDAEAVLRKALEHFHIAAQLEPFNADYARGYAETFHGLKNPDWKAAREAWVHYLTLAENKDFAYANLTRIEIKLGRKREAEEWLSKIERQDFDRLKKRLRAQIDDL